MAAAAIQDERLPGGRKVVPMALSNHDQAQIRGYLLGKLNEAEQERIEDRLMVEDELSDELEASKDDLVEEYCAGELNQADRRWFEEHFLATPEGQQRHLFVLTMDCLQETRVPVRAEPKVDVDPRPSFLQRLAILFKTQKWAMGTVASLVLLVGAVFVITSRRPGSEGQTFSATLASPNLTRGAEAPVPTRVNLPPNTAVLKLRLQFSKPAAVGTRYKAELDDRVNRKPIDIVASDSESVTVVIPTTMISPGQYAVKLLITFPDGNEQERSYRFTID